MTSFFNSVIIAIPLSYKELNFGELSIITISTPLNTQDYLT